MVEQLSAQSPKRCSKCGETKLSSAFSKNKRTKDGLQWHCRACRNTADKARYRANKQSVLARHHAYYAENTERCREQQKRYYAANHEKAKACRRTSYQRHIAKRRATTHRYYKANRQKIFARMYERRRTDINVKLRWNLRSRLSNAIRCGAKAGSAVRDLGCSIEELRVYLAALFSPGMSWENYGEWHIDHIRPLVSFDLTDSVQVKQACQYTNLQPLWAADNRSKGAKVIEAVA